MNRPSAPRRRARLPRVADRVWAQALRPLAFRASAQATHERLPALLRALDARALRAPLTELGRHAAPPVPVEAGGVRLPTPYVVAAGLVKGEGFADEPAALAAVAAGRDVVPGWRGVPAALGPVEFGSYTRHPRVGNAGVVAWRDAATRTTRNRVGLRNPGARAAAAFLARHRTDLPRVFGINVAASPGVADDDAQADEVASSLDAFLAAGVRPAWFTLNLSCPNTEDDPSGQQTTERARRVCGAARAALGAIDPVPLWVKVGPGLPDARYRALVGALAEAGVRAVVATNTAAAPVPGAPGTVAGMGGGALHGAAVAAASALTRARDELDAPLDVIGCGGVLDGASRDDFARLGVRAFQYWSALIYRGPFAAALVHDERARAGEGGAP